MEENGALIQFLYSGEEVVAATKEGEGTTRYIRGYGLISSDSEQARTYYHYVSDEKGSVTHLVSSEGERVLNEYSYDVFGNRTVLKEAVDNLFGYKGQQYDGITGQYYLRARYYNPVIGRFIQEDTYYGDGLNLYAYCCNNPVTYYDPTGHEHEVNHNRGGADGDSDSGKKSDSRKQTSDSEEKTGSSSKKPKADVPENGPSQKKSGSNNVPAGYYQDKNGRWHRPNGQFASNAEVGLPAPNRNKGGNSGGRLGNESTRAQNKQIADYLIDQGYTITGGGGRGPEEYLPGPNNGRKGSNYLDITAVKGDETIRINTVDTYADGTPTAREMEAARAINDKTGEKVILIPKGTGLGNLPDIIGRK